MNPILSFGISFIIAFQSLGAWLEAPMKFFSFLGSEEFFIVFLPLVYWSIDAALGLRLGFILLFGTGLNELFKLPFHGPRPYWLSTNVRPLASETSFGVPSGHSQISAGFWGMLAAHFRKAWIWIIALLLVIFIGLSRLYLGVHFPHDVLIGWTLGFLTLWAFVKFWEPIAKRVKAMTFWNQIGLAFAVSLILILPGAFFVYLSRGWTMPAEWIANAARGGGPSPNPFSLSGLITASATLFGLCFGLSWMAPRGGFSAEGPVAKRALRFIVGLIGVGILYIGLKLILPDGDAFVPYLFRYIRYALLGFWVTGGAIWVFSKIKLV
jgi:membrane-associated phospholipid phosphatase